MNAFRIRIFLRALAFGIATVWLVSGLSNGDVPVDLPLSNDTDVLFVRALPENFSHGRELCHRRAENHFLAQRLAPSDFNGIDFRNMSYESGMGMGRFRLVDGKFEKWLEKPVPALWTARFSEYLFRDFSNDGAYDALVELLEVHSVGSSSAIAAYKLFLVENGTLRLKWQVSTGSESNCGPKDIRIAGNKIILEVFGDCKTPNSGSTDESFGDRIATNTTEFTYVWDGRTMALESRRVTPFPYEYITDVPQCLLSDALYD
jgi:hypothetical protein